jgi:hypothetical protein
MDNQSNKQPDTQDPSAWQQTSWAYWLSDTAALVLVLLVLMYAIRRYRGSRPYVPKDIGVSFDVFGRSVRSKSACHRL